MIVEKSHVEEGREIKGALLDIVNEKFAGISFEKISGRDVVLSEIEAILDENIRKELAMEYFKDWLTRRN